MKLTLGQSIKIIALSTICLMAGVSTAAQVENVKTSSWCTAPLSAGLAGARSMTFLLKMAIKVTLVQEPLTSFKEDIAATQRVLNQQDGPVILVGHSYGSTIISEAGNDSHVAGLVYIAAHVLDVGKSSGGNGKKYPNSAHPYVKTPDGFMMLAPANYPADFGADLPAKQAKFEAQAQMPTAAGIFSATIDNPAWKTKPSWYMVAKADKIINPDLEWMYAQRAKSHTVEVASASHSVYESHSKRGGGIDQAGRRAGGEMIPRCALFPCCDRLNDENIGH